MLSNQVHKQGGFTLIELAASVVILALLYAIYTNVGASRIHEARFDAEIEAATRLAEQLNTERRSHNPASPAGTIEHYTFAPGTGMAAVNATLGTTYPVANTFGINYEIMMADHVVSVTTDIPGQYVYNNTPMTYDMGTDISSITVYSERKLQSSSTSGVTHFEKSFMFGKPNTY